MSTGSVIDDERSPDLGGSESEDPDQAPRAERDHRWWLAPLRWIRKTASAVLRPIRALIRSPFRLVKTVFMATIGRNRGFGFWWLIATLALAVAIGLLVGLLLSPVLGLLAAIGVGIWMLMRRSHDSDSESDSDSDESDDFESAAAEA